MENINNIQDDIIIRLKSDNNENEKNKPKNLNNSKSLVDNFQNNYDLFNADSIKTNKTKHTEENYDNSYFDKEFLEIKNEFNTHKNNFTHNILNTQSVDQKEFIKLFSYVEKQNIFIKEIQPFIQKNKVCPESKNNQYNSVNDNNFVNKISELKTKLSEKEKIINVLQEEIKNLKNQEKNPIKKEKVNLNKSELLNSEQEKKEFFIFENLLENEKKISANFKHNNSLLNENRINTSNYLNTEEKYYDENLNTSFSYQNLFTKNPVNPTNLFMPGFCSRNKLNLLNHDNKSKSFCFGSGHNFDIDLNNSNLEPNDKIIEIFSDNIHKNKINSTEEEKNNFPNLIEEINSFTNYKNFNLFNNHTTKLLTTSVEIEMKNNSFTDNLEHNAVFEIHDEDNNNIFEEKNTLKNNNSLSEFTNITNNCGFSKLNIKNLNNEKKNVDILNQIKESFLSLSSCENSMNNSMHNGSDAYEKLKNYEKENKKNDKIIRRKTFSSIPRINNLSDIENIPNKNKKSLNTTKNSKFNKISNKINNNFQDNVMHSDEINEHLITFNINQDENINENYNKNKNLNLNFIYNEIKSPGYNLISNSPIHQNLEDINIQLNKFDYKTLKSDQKLIDGNNFNTFNNFNNYNSQIDFNIININEIDLANIKIENKPVKINKSNSVVMRRKFIEKNKKTNEKIKRKIGKNNLSELEFNSEPNNLFNNIDLGKLNFTDFYDLNYDKNYKYNYETSKNKEIQKLLFDSFFYNDNKTTRKDINDNKSSEQNSELNFSFNDSKNINNSINNSSLLTGENKKNIKCLNNISLNNQVKKTNENKLKEIKKNENIPARRNSVIELYKEKKEVKNPKSKIYSDLVKIQNQKLFTVKKGKFIKDNIENVDKNSYIDSNQTLDTKQNSRKLGKNTNLKKNNISENKTEKKEKITKIYFENNYNIIENENSSELERVIKNSLKNNKKFSRSSCDLTNEIFLNFNNEGVFSLKPNEKLDISENEDIINDLENSDCKKNNNIINIHDINIQSNQDKINIQKNNNSLHYDNKTPSDKKIKNITNDSSIMKIGEYKNFSNDNSEKNSFKNKLTKSQKFINSEKTNYENEDKNPKNKMSIRSKSFVNFDEIKNKQNINLKEKKKNLNNNESLRNYHIQKLKKNNINENKEKINTPLKYKKKINLPTNNKLSKTSLNTDSNSGQPQNTISYNFINNISINSTIDGSSSMILETDRPLPYTKRLLAKYHKYIDDYNKKNYLNSSLNNSLNSSKLNESKTVANLYKK